MLKPEEAWNLIAPHLRPLEPIRLQRHAALGHLLAEPVDATVDLPQADVSAMDGYVLAGHAEIGESLPVVSTIAAGVPPSLVLEPGTAARIMTGAVVPEGGDRVVPVELTDGGERFVRIDRAAKPGAHIRRRGEVIARGAPLLAPGTHLVPGAISLLAAHGHEHVSVIRRPTVAVLTTGDEVVPPSQEPAPGQLRDSNGPFLQAALATIGLPAIRLGIAPDDRKAMTVLLREGLAADVLLVTGGVSMGAFDFAEELLQDLGCELLFDAVAMQPGKPLVVGRHAVGPRDDGVPRDAEESRGAGWVLGLPGNPASVMVTFWLFARPLLNSLLGREDGFWHGALEAESATELPAGKDRDRFLAASLHRTEGRLVARVRSPRGSHDLAAYGQGRALLRIPPHAAPTPTGGRCQVLPLVDWPEDPR
jgi:molybdopterin molybdotransferase